MERGVERGVGRGEGGEWMGRGGGVEEEVRWWEEWSGVEEWSGGVEWRSGDVVRGRGVN